MLEFLRNNDRRRAKAIAKKEKRDRRSTAQEFFLGGGDKAATGGISGLNSNSITGNTQPTLGSIGRSGALSFGVQRAYAPSNPIFPQITGELELITLHQNTGTIAGDRTASVLHSDLLNSNPWGITKFGTTYQAIGINGLNYKVRGATTEDFSKTGTTSLGWKTGDRFNSAESMSSIQNNAGPARAYNHQITGDFQSRTGTVPPSQTGDSYQADGPGTWSLPNLGNAVPTLTGSSAWNSTGVWNGLLAAYLNNPAIIFTADTVTAIAHESHLGTASGLTIPDYGQSCEPFTYSPSTTGIVTYPGMRRSKAMTADFNFTQPFNYVWRKGGVETTVIGTRSWTEHQESNRVCEISPLTYRITAACNGLNGTVRYEISELENPRLTLADCTEARSLSITENCSVEVLPGQAIALSGTYADSLSSQLDSFPPGEDNYGDTNGVPFKDFGSEHYGNWFTGYSYNGNYNGSFLYNVIYDDSATSVLYTKIGATISTVESGQYVNTFNLQVTDLQGRPKIRQIWNGREYVGERLPPNLGNMIQGSQAIAVTPPTLPEQVISTATTNFTVIERIYFNDGTERDWGTYKTSIVGAQASANLPTMTVGSTATISIPTERIYSRILTQTVISNALLGNIYDLSHQGTLLPSPIGDIIYVAVRSAEKYLCYRCEITAIALIDQTPSIFARHLYPIIRGAGVGEGWRIRDRVASITVNVLEQFSVGAVPKIPPANGFSFFTVRHASDLVWLYDQKRTSIKKTTTGWDVYFCGNHSLGAGPQYAAIAKLALDGTMTWDQKAQKTRRYIPNTSTPEWIRA
jgi:hypothetical protein